MKKFVLFGLISVFLLLLASSTVSAYCNETITYQDSQNYTIAKTCTENHNNTSFISIIVVFLFFASALILSLFFVDKVWLKTILALGLSILVMSLTRFMSWFMEITNPQEIELINTLDHFYLFGVWGFRMVMIASMFIVLIIILNSFKKMKNRKKDSFGEWDE